MTDDSQLTHVDLLADYDTPGWQTRRRLAKDLTKKVRSRFAVGAASQ
jgi:hypothetical protein